MSSGHVRDLTSGPILNHLSALAIPAALGMLFHTLYNITDVYFASMLSTNSQAGLSLGYLVYFFVAAFGFGLNAAMAGLMGNAIGKDDANTSSLAEFSAKVPLLLQDKEHDIRTIIPKYGYVEYSI